MFFTVKEKPLAKLFILSFIHCFIISFQILTVHFLLIIYSLTVFLMKRIAKKLVALALMCLMTTTVFAQGGYTVKGIVSDETGPIMGATV